MSMIDPPKNDEKTVGVFVGSAGLAKMCETLAADPDVIRFLTERSNLGKDEFFVTVTYAVMSIKELQKEISDRLFESLGRSDTFRSIS